MLAGVAEGTVGFELGGTVTEGVEAAEGEVTEGEGL